MKIDIPDDLVEKYRAQIRKSNALRRRFGMMLAQEKGPSDNALINLMGDSHTIVDEANGILQEIRSYVGKAVLEGIDQEPAPEPAPEPSEKLEDASAARFRAVLEQD